MGQRTSGLRQPKRSSALLGPWRQTRESPSPQRSLLPHWMSSVNRPSDPDAELLGILGVARPVARTRDRVVEAFVGRYARPTSLQRQALDAVQQGDSILIVAPTASGKTEAGIMPLAVETL